MTASHRTAPRHPSRRDFMAMMALASAGLGHPVRAGQAPRIVSLDYGLSSTLLSLGVVPVAIADLADWGKWVVDPVMPEGVIDLGSAREANFEILTMLKPDFILTTPYLDALLPKIKTLAPVLRLEIYTPESGPKLDAAIAATRKLGSAIGRSREADAFLAEAETFFSACRDRLADRSIPPLALVNFMDARHARIYGKPGLFDSTLERLGLRNAWREESNYWGFQTIAVEELSRVADTNARLIAFEPVPADVLPKLRQSPLWMDLPFAQPGHFAVLPAALMFGMINESMRFARLLTDFLVSDP